MKPHTGDGNRVTRAHAPPGAERHHLDLPAPGDVYAAALAAMHEPLWPEPSTPYLVVPAPHHLVAPNLGHQKVQLRAPGHPLPPRCHSRARAPLTLPRARALAWPPSSSREYLLGFTEMEKENVLLPSGQQRLRLHTTNTKSYMLLSNYLDWRSTFKRERQRYMWFNICRFLAKSICTPRTSISHKFPKNLRNQPLNVEQWHIKSLPTLTHYIYHTIDIYDDCHTHAFSLRTHEATHTHISTLHTSYPCLFFEFYLQFMCSVWWQSSWNAIWYLIEHSFGVATGFGYVVVYFFRLTLELQYDMWYIISSLAIVVSLFRLHMCRFTLSMLFF